MFFNHRKIKLRLSFNGKDTVTPELPFEWHNNLNVRVITLKSFCNFCAANRMKVLKEFAIVDRIRIVRFPVSLTSVMKRNEHSEKEWKDFS
jgi:hypothetical protein